MKINLPNHYIDVVITPTTQMHISSPISDTRLDNDGNTLHRTLQGRAVVQTVTRPIYVAGHLKGNIPVIPASTIKGRMRHIATHLWLKSLGSSLPSEALAHAMLSGAALSKGLSADLRRSVMLEAAKHPFAGLFGGGPNRLHGNLTVFDAVPITVATLEAALVPSQYANLVMVKHTSLGTKPVEPWEVVEYDHTNRNSTSEIDVVDKQAEKLRNSAMYSWQVIPAGTPMFLRITLPAMAETDIRIALAIECLRALAHLGTIGGRLSAGYGRFGVDQVKWTQVDVPARKIVAENLIFDEQIRHEFLPSELRLKKKTIAFSNAEALKKMLGDIALSADNELHRLNTFFGNTAARKARAPTQTSDE